MPVVFGASGRYLRRTANLPASSTSITVAAWIYIDSVRSGEYQYWLAVENAATDATKYINMGYNNAGAFRIMDNDAARVTATAPANSTWIFCALTCAGTGGTDAVGYYRAVTATTFTKNSTTGTSFTPAAIYVGNDSYDEWTHTRSGPVYVFDRVLTEAELLHLSHSIRPNVGGTMPVLWSPLWSTSDVQDYSGNGYNWTVGGTLSNADMPPVSWGAQPWIVPFVAASGTTYNQSAGGTLTTAGATVRSTHKVVAGALTTAGALAKRAAKSLAGTLTTAGTAIKRTAKTHAGTLTTAGALASSRLYSLAIAGTLTTAGALARQTNKTLAGTLTTAGAIIRRTAKSLAGTLTTAGGLVADFISGSATYSQAVGGTLTTAGALARSTSKSLAGTLDTAGTITRRIAKSLAGVLSTAGALLREWFSPSAAKLDVTLTDALTYTCTLTDARVYTCTLADALTYTVTLGDSTT